LIESDEIGEKIDQMGLMEILEGKPWTPPSDDGRCYPETNDAE
jgi:hypothetical protein